MVNLIPPLGGAALPGIDPQRRPERRPGVTGGRLPPDAVERSLVADTRVHHAVQRHTSCQAEITLAGGRLQPADKVEDGLFKHDLQGAGDIEVLLLQRSAAGAGRSEPLFETGRLDRVGAVFALVDDAPECVDIGGLSKGGQGHDLVFIGGVEEAEILRDLLVEDAEGVGHPNLADAVQLIAASLEIPCSRLFAASIKRQDGRALEWRGEKRARRVRDMMLDEMPLVGTVRARALKASGKVMRGS